MKTVKCTNDYKCQISVNCEEVLVVNFNIKSYKACNFGWHEFDFPDSIIIQDKLYLDEQLKDKVIKVLEDFIKTGVFNPPNMEHTPRGFGLLNLTDLKGNIISIQESSSAMESKIWFGCKTEDKAFMNVDGNLIPYEYQKGDICLEDRLHLNQKTAKNLRDAIVSEWEASACENEEIVE